MRTATATLKGIAPYSQSRNHVTEKKPKESDKDYEERTWINRLHVTQDGKIFMPPMAFKFCLAAAARRAGKKIPGKGRSTYTKHFESGILVSKGPVLDLTPEDVKPDWVFVDANGQRGSGRRVWRCYPTIDEWEADVEFHVIDDVITEEVFREILEEAGVYIGLGRFRAENQGLYGRFTVEKIRWS